MAAQKRKFVVVECYAGSDTLYQIHVVEASNELEAEDMVPHEKPTTFFVVDVENLPNKHKCLIV